jgi:hypothetical protein
MDGLAGLVQPRHIIVRQTLFDGIGVMNLLLKRGNCDRKPIDGRGTVRSMMHWHTNAMMNRSFMTVSLFIVYVEHPSIPFPADYWRNG